MRGLCGWGCVGAWTAIGLGGRRELLRGLVATEVFEVAGR